MLGRMLGRPYLVPLLVLLVGITASFTIYFLTVGSNHSDRKDAFLHTADHHFFAIEKRLAASRDLLSSLQGVIETSTELKRYQFDHFSQTLLQNHPEVQALEWIPRVSNHRRYSYEIRAQAEGYSGFVMKERIVNDGKSQLAPVIYRPEYYPVFFAYPLAGNEAAIGFDLGSNPERLMALEAARDSGEMVMSQGLTLVQEEGGQAGTLLMLPVYQPEASTDGDDKKRVPETIQKRRELLKGFVVVVLRIGDLIEMSRANLEGELDITLTDVENAEILYENRNDSRNDSRNESQSNQKPEPEFSFHKTKTYGQREWLFSLYPTSGAFRNTQEMQELLVLLGPLALSILSAGYIFVLLRSYQALRRQNRSLEEREQRLSLAVSSAELGTWEWGDVTEDAQVWSPHFYRLLGYENDEIRASQQTFMASVHPEDTAKMQQALSNLVQQEGGFDLECRLKTKTDKYNWFRATARIRKNAGLNTSAVIGTLQDIHEHKSSAISLKAYAKDLKKSNGELEQFASVASHDLKAPLQGIGKLAELIELNIQRQRFEDTENYLSLLKGRLSRMQALLASLLEYSRIGQKPDEHKPVDLNAMIGDVTDLLAVQDHGFEVRYNLPTIEAPLIVLNQTFQNLIGNAIKHHDQGKGLIEIEHDFENDNHVFAIKDDGPGIPNEMQERVFKMFQTLRPRDEVEGSGMGLAIVKKLVVYHGGNIWIENKDQGVGTTVKFSLPAKVSAKIRA